MMPNIEVDIDHRKGKKWYNIKLQTLPRIDETLYIDNGTYIVKDVRHRINPEGGHRILVIIDWL